MKPQRMKRDAVRPWLQAYIESSTNPDLRHYGSTVLGSIDHFLWTTEHLMQLGRMHGARVLEVGCGFGWQAFAVSLLGGTHVTATDIRETMTSAVEERLEALRAQGAAMTVDVAQADICSLNGIAASFDAILCVEAIEHIHDLEAMFDNCARLLRPGGRLVIMNDANALNAEEVAELSAMWQRRDRDWDYIEELKRQRPIENAGIKPYAVMREEVVRAANPALADEAVRQIVDATAGLRDTRIAEIARAYSAATRLPSPPAFSSCRNPVTGEYCERLLDPFEVATLLRAAGFVPSVRHVFRKMPLRLLNGIGLRAVNHALFRLRPAFAISAVRR